MNIRKYRFIGIILLVLFIISAVISGTLGWQHLNQTTISLATGESNAEVNVELILREKQETKMQEEIVIPNTSFYLFTEEGEQIGGRYLTDKNGKINVNLTKGNYYFEEITPTTGYTFDKKDGKNITKYPFTVYGKFNEKVIVEAYNIRLEGCLIVQNTVENSDGSILTDEQLNQEFIFTITFSDGGTYKYSLNNNEEISITSGDTFTLKHAQTVTFDEIPLGVLYNITQIPVEGYLITSNAHRGHITEDKAIAEFINTYKEDNFATITITKEVLGENADLDKEFTFEIEFKGENVPKNTTFKLKSDEEKSFENIPIGTEYIVTEEELENKEYISAIKQYTGRIIRTEEIMLPFLNIYNEQLEQEETGNIIIHKEVLGKNGDLDKEFTFEIEFEGENAPEDTTFKLKSDEEKNFENIPYGVTYTVKEIDTNGYIPTFETVSGTIAQKQTINIDFKNTIPPKDEVKLLVSKELKGEYLETDEQKEFEFTLLIAGKKTNFTLKANETKEFDIAIGSIYEIQEKDYFSDGYVQKISNGNGIAGDVDIQADVTNTYVGIVKTLIKGTKTWDIEHNTNITLPKSIIVKLKNRDLLYEEKEVKPDKNGNWEYNFIVPKYNKDGDKITYTIEEALVESFIATYNKYNITNTYVEPIEVTLPTVEKLVEGENAPKTKFEFVLKAQEEQPLPQNSENSRKFVSINGAGTVDFGKITFTNPGVYKYTISELNGGIKGWEYDKSTYTVTITITEKNGKLLSKTIINKDKKESKEIVFTNTYNQAILGENVLVSGQKSWEHGNNPENKQPKSIIINVYGDGNLVVQKQVTGANNWKYSFELPKFDKNGKQIEYTIDEVKIAEYEKIIDGYYITNKYIETQDSTNPIKPVVPENPTDSKNPQTGDNIIFWFTLMIISGTMLIIYFFANRKKGRHYK